MLDYDRKDTIDEIISVGEVTLKTSWTTNLTDPPFHELDDSDTGAFSHANADHSFGSRYVNTSAHTTTAITLSPFTFL